MGSSDADTSTNKPIPAAYPPVSAAEQSAFRRAQQGDRDAFGRLKTLLEPAVRRFLYRLIGTATGAADEEDVVSEVFVALYRSLARLDADRLRPFVFRVTRNLAYERLRRAGRQPTMVPLETTAAILPASGECLEQAVFWSQAYAEVQRAIDALPEPQRIALLLHAEEGFTNAQIAEATGADIGTVKSRIHHARRGLARRLPPDTLNSLGLAPTDTER